MISWVKRLGSWAFILMVVYGLIYTFWFQRRLSIDAATVSPLEGSIFALLFQACLIIPFYAMIPLFLMETKRDNFVAKIWRTISRYSIQIGLGITVMCLILAVFKVPGVWWSWISFGLMAGMMSFVVARHGTDKLKLGEALILGIGIFSFVAATWEMPYQLCTALIHRELTGFTLQSKLMHEMFIQVPLMTGGLFIMWFYARKYKLFRFTRISLMLLVLYIGAWFLWIKLGFYLDWVYADGKWILNTPVPTTYIQSIGAKGSKVIYNFLLVSMLGGFDVKRLFSR